QDQDREERDRDEHHVGDVLIVGLAPPALAAVRPGQGRRCEGQQRPGEHGYSNHQATHAGSSLSHRRAAFTPWWRLPDAPARAVLYPLPPAPPAASGCTRWLASRPRGGRSEPRKRCPDRRRRLVLIARGYRTVARGDHGRRRDVDRSEPRSRVKA